MMLHRGPQRHRLHMPWYVRLIGMHSGWTYGPETFVMGSFTRASCQHGLPSHLARWWRACGIHDEYAVRAAAARLQQAQSPDFMMIYLPDLDHAAHRKNPQHLRDALLQLDQHVQRLLNAFGSWQEAVRDHVWVVLGDHGQTQIGGQAVSQINLDRLLQRFRVLPLGKQAKEMHEVAVANNERMAYVYPLQTQVVEALREVLLCEVRFDLVAWKDGDWAVAVQPGSRRTLRFRRAGPKEQHTGSDRFGTFWQLDGDVSVLDVTAQNGVLLDGDYPDGLARLYAALCAQALPLFIVNARPRYEIHMRFFLRYKNGGAHGSLHRTDTEVPLLIAGGPTKWARHLREHATSVQRMVDVKPFILTLFDAQNTAQDGVDA
jgi:hypothetical protein